MTLDTDTPEADAVGAVCHLRWPELERSLAKTEAVGKSWVKYSDKSRKTPSSQYLGDSAKTSQPHVL